MWSKSKGFGVSVSVKSSGCDGYPDEDSDESCEYFLLNVMLGSTVHPTDHFLFHYVSHIGKKTYPVCTLAILNSVSVSQIVVCCSEDLYPDGHTSLVHY